jgi:regulatory protein
MKKVTATYSGKGSKKRLSIRIDGNQPFGQAMTGSEPVPINKLDIAIENGASMPEIYNRCLKAAVRFLRYRPRSEFEVRERLRHRGFDNQIIELTIATLKEKKLIDDQAFARFWVENRDSFSPRSQYMLKLELRQKGLASDIIEQIVAQTDDTEGAYQAARRKSHSLSHLDYDNFYRRLCQYLQRRGFGYGIIPKVVTQVWNERSETALNHIEK